MIMSPSDLPAPHIDGAHHRREPAQKPREVRPLWTHDPLPHDREKKPATQPKKRRKHVLPTTPALSFDPKRNHVPSGKQDPPVSPVVYSRPSTSESSTSSQDEHQMTPFTDHENYEQPHNGCDAHKRPRVCPEHSPMHSTSFYPGTSYPDANDMNMGPGPSDFYDSPVSSSPAPSDQSPRGTEFPVQIIDYVPPVQHMYGYGQPYVPQPVVHQDPYSYAMDRPAQGYPVQYPDPSYGRQVPHGVPAYPECNGYLYPPRKY